MGEAVYLKTTCLKCGGNVEFLEAQEGATVPCPHCGKDLFLYRGVRAVGASAMPAPKPKSAENFFRTPCEHCGAHVEFAPELEGTTILCPHCRKNKVLLRRFVRSETVGTPPANSPPQQKISESPTPANPNEGMPLIGQVVGGIVVGIIAALGIGLACLLASKMGWDGLGGFVSSWISGSVADFRFSLLGIAVGFAIMFFLQKKKNQTFKDAFKSATPIIGLAVSMFICLPLTISIFYSPPPAKRNIDYGVNWALSTDYNIDWRDSKVNLFDSYKLINQYRETVGSEKHFVYDFEAECPLVVYRLPDGSGRVEYAQFRGDASSRLIKLDGSVTLVKKGKEWYCSRTIRVH